MNDTIDSGVRIIAAARSEEKFRCRFEERVNRDDLCFVKYDSMGKILFEDSIDYIIHAASPANPKMYGSNPVETMLVNIIGLNNLLELSAEKDVNRLLYISSSEVYGLLDSADGIEESKSGFVDFSNSRSCYPSSKRAAETLCASYNKEYGVDSVIVRPGHVFGPTMTEEDNRAASSFLRDAANDRRIVMKSKGEQLRSHCYVVDCVSAIFAVLINGKKGEAYNISNPKTISSIYEYAKCIADNSKVEIVKEVPSEEESKNYNPMQNSSLNSMKLEMLGWKGVFDLNEAIAHTLKELSGGNYQGD